VANQEDLNVWPVEQIPNTDTLYMRVHRSFVTDGDFDMGVFRDQDGGMSTEWGKYATPTDVRNRSKNPADNGVIEMIVADIISISGLTVQHSPDQQSGARGHTDVFGNKKAPGVRLKLKRIAQWSIRL
jgi:hypothetical protein